MKRLTVTQAARIIRQGGIVAYPTETFYGLAAMALNLAAVERLFEIKGRERVKPVSIIIPSLSHLSRWAAGVSSREKKLIRYFWPGPLTLVFRAKKSVSPILTAGSGKIGIRISPSPMAQGLAKRVGSAITATSANMSGRSAARTAAEVFRQLGALIDGIVVGSRRGGKRGSTVLDVTGPALQVIREGVVSKKTIQQFLEESL